MRSAVGGAIIGQHLEPYATSFADSRRVSLACSCSPSPKGSTLLSHYFVTRSDTAPHIYLPSINQVCIARPPPPPVPRIHIHRQVPLKSLAVTSSLSVDVFLSTGSSYQCIVRVLPPPPISLRYVHLLTIHVVLMFKFLFDSTVDRGIWIRYVVLFFWSNSSEFDGVRMGGVLAEST